MDDYDDYVEPITSMELALREQQMDLTLTKLSTSKRPFRLPSQGASREQIKDAFNTAFELIGGVPRLAIWANENPDKFYSIFARLNGGGTSSSLSGKLTVEHVLRRNPLDEVTIDGTGRVVTSDE
jgi:hypothetical protein